ncbi:MAG TPA: hypothetical protein VFZ27_06725 [Terriglobia bacterium]|nr:hypothetical protein [Terriglobia bacterium]
MSQSRCDKLPQELRRMARTNFKQSLSRRETADATKRASAPPAQRVVMGLTTENMPTLTLNDPAGFTLNLGSTATEKSATGQRQQTSASSIAMSDKDHHVTWRAP